MLELINQFFTGGRFIPHGHCYLWKPELVWLHIAADVLIALAYYSIPILLIYFVRQREDVPFKGIFWLFGAFIICCGTTHVMEVWTLWHPAYWLSGLLKAITAVVSLYTASALVPVIPQALALPSSAQLEAANLALQEQIKERQQAEEEKTQLIISLRESKLMMAKQTQELARSNAELEQFAYVASHDLQEPLRGIISLVQLLEIEYKGQLNQEADEYIEYIVTEATRMQQLIKDLLAFSRVGTKEKKFSPTACEQVIKQVLVNLTIPIQESNAVVSYDSLPTVMASFSELTQLFQNLISNAIKFRGEELPRIHISAELKQDEWVFCVQDNGIGIEPQYAELIFVIFQRLHSRRKYKGTGIGLAICRKIVERQGGKIWIESELGQGTAFYLTIPNKSQKEEGVV